MGSDFVTFQQDPWAGNFATTLANSIRAAPKQALDQTMTVEQIWKLREERAREAAKWDAAKKAADLVDANTPEARVDPSFRDIPYQPQGPVQPDPEAPAPPPGSAPELLPETTIRESFIDPKALALANKQRDFGVAGARAGILSDPKAWAQQGAHAEVAATGMPTDPRRRGTLQYQATGRFPTSDESKLQGATNFTIYKNGESTGRQYSTRDGRTTLEGRPISSMYDPAQGEVALESAAAPMAQPNPIETPAIAQRNFYQTAQRIQEKIARGEPISNEELNNARAQRDAGWQRETHFGTDANTGAPTATPHYKVLPPESGLGAQLFDLLDAVDNKPMSRAATIARAAAAPPEPAPGGAPTVAPAAAPAPPRGVGEPRTIGVGAAKPVVDQYTSHKIVQAMDLAQSGYSSMVQNMPFDNAASDLAIFIGAAKVLDPPSVVREQEGKNVSRTASPMDQFYGMLNRAQGGSGLTRETRAQIWNMVNEKLRQDIANVVPIREQHAVQLKQRGINPEEYLPALPKLQEIKREIINGKSINADDPARPLVVPSTIDPYGGKRAVSPTAPRGARSAAPPAAPAPPPIIERGNAVFGD